MVKIKHGGVSIHFNGFSCEWLFRFYIEIRLMGKVSLTVITVISYKTDIAIKIGPFLDIQSGHLAHTQKYEFSINFYPFNPLE